MTSAAPPTPSAAAPAPRPPQSPHPPPRPRVIIPLAVLGLSLTVTFAAAGYVAWTAALRDQLRFDNAVERSQIAIAQRLDTYVNLLKGGAALFAITDRVTRPQFQTYVERLDLHGLYPGISGIGV